MWYFSLVSFFIVLRCRALILLKCGIAYLGSATTSMWVSIFAGSSAVQNAMAAAGVQTPRAFARTIIRNPPPGWETSSFISGWAVKWANEVMPIRGVAKY